MSLKRLCFILRFPLKEALFYSPFSLKKTQRVRKFYFCRALLGGSFMLCPGTQKETTRTVPGPVHRQASAAPPRPEDESDEPSGRSEAMKRSIRIRVRSSGAPHFPSPHPLTPPESNAYPPAGRRPTSGHLPPLLSD